MQKHHAVFLILFLLFAGCSLENKHSRVFLAMGDIPVEVSIYADKSIDYEKVLDEIEDSIKLMDSLFSKYNPNSLTYIFNHGTGKIALDENMKKMVESALSINKETNGYFDIKIETVLAYYKRCEIEMRDISDDSIRYLKKKIKDDSIYATDDSLAKSDKDIMIDFGGIAKGFFGDKAIEIMIKNKVYKGIVNLGGDIVVINKNDKTPFKIGVRSFQSDSTVRIEEISNGGIVTSGDYFRYYEINGKKWCHIINPATGYPADDIHSVTVQAENGTLADAYATALMIMNEKERETFVNEHEEIKVYIQK